ncbi:MAG: hypothetical protein KKE23_00090, partial [Nanoarchaeota archaeon]|nr:hypothetical protein [Nanoarchaeota archaeon]
THLKFLIQGPYKTTPARDNIPKEDKWNKELIKETALLVADSISKIKESGLLTVDFLNVLPISEDDFPEGHMFRPIYNAVLEKFKSNEKLLPANDGSHISAKQAFLERGGGLIELLGTGQLSLLFGKEDCQWVDSNITENSPLWGYLDKKLEIRIVRPETFANLLNEDFLKIQSDEWFVKFYSFLLKPDDLWNKPSSILRKKKFIRLSNDNLVAPFNEDGSPQAYLPADYPSDFQTVKQTIAGETKVQEFLMKLGLYKPDLLTEVIENIFPKYLNSEIDISKEENIEHIRKIVKALQSEPSAKSQSELFSKMKMLFCKIGLGEYSHVLKESSATAENIQPFKSVLVGTIPFLISTNQLASKQKYKSSKEIYLPNVYTGDTALENLFDGNPAIWFLDTFYSDLPEIKIIIEKLNIANKPKIQTKEFNVYRGRYKRGFTCNYTMDGLEFCVRNNLFNSNSSYIWKLLILSQSDSSYKIELKGILEYANDRNFCGANAGKKEETTDIYKILTENEWLPDKNGNFHKPSNILLSDLPDDFEKDSKEAKALAEKLGFKKDIEQEYLSRLPEEMRRKIEYANTLTDDEIRLIEEERKRKRKNGALEEISREDLDYDNELAKAFNRPQKKGHEEGYIPPDHISDPNRRRERTQEEIKEARSNEPPIMKRFKRVPAKEWERKNNEVRTFLKEQY